jgi:hypothetical protein
MASTTTTSEGWPSSSNTSRTSEMIMSALLTEKTPAEPPWAGFLNKMRQTLSALLARRLRRAEAGLIALHDRILEKIGHECSEIRSVPMEDAPERTCGVRRRCCQHRVSG